MATLVAMFASLSYTNVIAAIICSFVFYLYCRRNSTLPMSWPFVGMLPTFLWHYEHLYDKATEVFAQNEGTFILRTTWFFGKDLLMTCNPENVNHVMSKHFWNYPKGPESKRIFDVFGDMLFNADLEEWKGHRKVAFNFLNDQRFHRFASRSKHEIVKELIPVIEHVAKEGMEVNIQDIFRRLTFDSTSMMLTGYNPRTLRSDFPFIKISKALDDASEVILYRHFVPETLWKIQRWLGVGEEKRLAEARDALDDWAAEFIKRKEEDLRLSRDDPDGYDALKCYLTVDEIMGPTLHPYKDLRDTLVGLMIAGRETTSVALTWFFWLLSDHPEVERKIIEELEEHGWTRETQKNLVVPPDDLLSKLVYLNGAISETLRLYPPVPFQCRAPIEPDVLPSGHVVKTNMKMVISSYGMARMKWVWGEDCLEFKPERWITGKGMRNPEPSFKFLAFSSGPRICPAKEFAFNVMKAATAMIIPSYHIEVIKTHPVAPAVATTLQMKHGLMVRAIKRS